MRQTTEFDMNKSHYDYKLYDRIAQECEAGNYPLLVRTFQYKAGYNLDIEHRLGCLPVIIILAELSLLGLIVVTLAMVSIALIV